MISTIEKIAVEAGKQILEVYQSAVWGEELKGDGSPLTLADKKSHLVIMRHLNEYFPGIPVLSEEGMNILFEERSLWEKYFLVDPLDGTKEFLKRNGEFTVNIALIDNGKPVLGVVYAPVLDLLYSGDLTTTPVAMKNGEPIHVQSLIEGTVTVVASRSHGSEETEVFIKNLEEKFGTVNRISMGSSLKICLVAEGQAWVYPRLAPTMEWDTAAAHAVVLAAGGRIIDYNSKEEIRYNKENLLNPYFVVEAQSNV